MNNIGHGIEVIKVDGFVDLPNQISGHSRSRAIPKQSAATTSHEHRTHFGYKVVIETLPNSVLKKGQAIPTSPHVSGDISQEVWINHPIGSQVERKSATGVEKYDRASTRMPILPEAIEMKKQKQGSESRPDYITRNRQYWETLSREYEEPGRRAWQSEEPRWGLWDIPESELRV